ncbi:unnamed protein product [Camellia sinensis]
MDTVAKHHIENEWAPKGDNVVVTDMAKKFTFELACQLLLNVTDSKQVAKFDNPFGNVIAGMMSVPIDFPGTSFNRAIKDANLIRKELLTLIKERKMAVQKKKKKKKKTKTRSSFETCCHTCSSHQMRMASS